jgi:hypothetical protein
MHIQNYTQNYSLSAVGGGGGRCRGGSGVVVGGGGGGGGGVAGAGSAAGAGTMAWRTPSGEVEDGDRGSDGKDWQRERNE